MSITEAAGGRRTAKADAMEFLQAALAGDPVPATEVSRMAHEHGLTAKAIRSAREALGVEIERNGFGPGSKSLWSLPGGRMDAPPSDEKVSASWKGPNLSETHRPKTIDGYEVIGLEPDEPCTYCGERGDDTVYLMQGCSKVSAASRCTKVARGMVRVLQQDQQERQPSLTQPWRGSAYLPDTPSYVPNAPLRAQHSLWLRLSLRFGNISPCEPAAALWSKPRSRSTSGPWSGPAPSGMTSTLTAR